MEKRTRNLNFLFSLSIFPEDLKTQVGIFSFYFPKIKVPQKIPPLSAFALVRWQSVGRSYQSALKKVIQILKGGFKVHLEIDLEKIERKEELLKQDKDIFWGKMRFFGNLSPHTMKKIKKKGCFLGVFEVICLILTHLGKLPRSVGFNCIGDRCRPSYYQKRKHLIYHPFVYLDEDDLWIGCEWEGAIKIDHLTPIFDF